MHTGILEEMAKDAKTNVSGQNCGTQIFPCLLVVCCVALCCLLSIPSWELGLAWGYVSSHISAGGGLDLPGTKRSHRLFSRTQPSQQAKSFFPLSRSSSPSSGYNHLGSGLMWGSVCGLTRISVTSPALLPLPRATYQASYNYNVDMRHNKQYYQGYRYIWKYICISIYSQTYLTGPSLAICVCPRPAQLAQLPRSEFNPKLFSHRLHAC